MLKLMISRDHNIFDPVHLNLGIAVLAVPDQIIFSVSVILAIRLDDIFLYWLGSNMPVLLKCHILYSIEFFSAYGAVPDQIIFIRKRITVIVLLVFLNRFFRPGMFCLNGDFLAAQFLAADRTLHDQFITAVFALAAVSFNDLFLDSLTKGMLCGFDIFFRPRSGLSNYLSAGKRLNYSSRISSFTRCLASRFFRNFSGELNGIRDLNCGLLTVLHQFERYFSVFLDLVALVILSELKRIKVLNLFSLFFAAVRAYGCVENITFALNTGIPVNLCCGIAAIKCVTERRDYLMVAHDLAASASSACFTVFRAGSFLHELSPVVTERIKVSRLGFVAEIALINTCTRLCAGRLFRGLGQLPSMLDRLVSLLKFAASLTLIQSALACLLDRCITVLVVKRRLSHFFRFHNGLFAVLAILHHNISAILFAGGSLHYLFDFVQKIVISGFDHNVLLYIFFTTACAAIGNVFFTILCAGRRLSNIFLNDDRIAFFVQLRCMSERTFVYLFDIAAKLAGID